MLNLVLPKGSLEKATMELFEAADLPVDGPSAGPLRVSGPSVSANPVKRRSPLLAPEPAASLRGAARRNPAWSAGPEAGW